MFDRELAKEIIRQTLTAANRIERRFKGVQNSDDFLLSETGIDKLDAICMMLIAIGENLKNLDKVNYLANTQKWIGKGQRECGTLSAITTSI